MSNFDYSKTMMMKITLAKPDFKGGSHVWCNFEKALEYIKYIDNITLGVKKIVYLVGWQYLGHDDGYPAFFEVNEYLKRDCDKSAKDSLLWLINEAKNYNTIVSLHINVTDVYVDSPLYEEYISNNLVLLKKNGKPKVTGYWYDRPAYQVRYKAEYESGYFQKRVDRLFDLLPLKDIGTIHLDAFFVRKGLDTNIKEEKAYRRKMIEYFHSKGVDVTSEFIYRERNITGYKAHFGDSDTIGVIDSFWQPVYSRKLILKYPSDVLGCGKHQKSLSLDKTINYLIYANMHGEDILLKSSDWASDFIREFALLNIPYFYLNNFKRLSLKGIGIFRRLVHNQGVVSSIINQKIVQDYKILKKYNSVCMPIYWKENSYVIYNGDNSLSEYYIKGNKAKVYEVSKEGQTYCGECAILNDKLDFKPRQNVMYHVVVEK